MTDISRTAPAFNMMAVVGRLDSAKLRVHAERCLHVRSKNARCLRCADVCTTGAITRGADGHMVVDPEKCIGCGTCASACPSGCLEAANPSDAELEAALLGALKAGNPNERTLWIACEQAVSHARETYGAPTEATLFADGNPMVGVVCLGRAEESQLTEAVARGAARIYLVHDRCGSCVHAPGGQLGENICASMASLLTAVHSSAVVERIPADSVAWTPAIGTADAPTFTAQAADAEEEAAAAAAADSAVFAHVQRDGTLPHFVPQRRLRLYNSLKRLAAADAQASAASQSEDESTITTRLWGQVTINTELCRSCRMCTVFCPTGAVSRFQTKDGGFGVEHRSTLCMQCRLCETICPEQAITVSDTVDFPEFLSGKKYRFEMQPVGWEPGGTHSIVTRMGRFFKTDGVQDPQAGVKPEVYSANREYLLEREEHRREIRAAEKNEAPS